MKLLKAKQPDKLNQNGVVSFITVMLLAMILTLITTAFVRSTISNQRQALDNQLSTQAFYAAESGVNDAVSLISNNLTDPAVLGAMNSTNCNDFIGVLNNKFGADVNVLDTTANIKYTCVLVKNVQNDIQVTKNVGEGAFYTVETTGVAVEKLSIEWINTSGGVDTPPAGSNLPSASTWGTAPALIKISIYYPPKTNFTRGNLITMQKTFFLRPSSSSPVSGFDVNSTNDGSIVPVPCSGTSCNVNLTNVFTLAGAVANKFYIRVTPIYNNADITIEAYDNSSKRLDLINAQYSFDVTGRANDVYRRINVRRGVNVSYDFPDSVVSSGDSLCKQFVAWPGASTTEMNEAGADCNPF